MFNFSSFVNICKIYSQRKSISNGEIVNELIEIIALAASIKDKNGEEYHLNNNRISELMNNKVDVPQIFKKVFETEDKILIEDITLNFDCFINKHISEDKIPGMKEALKTCLAEDENIDCFIKQRLLSKTDNENFLFECYKEAIKINNSFDESNNVKIWKNGINCVLVETADIFKFSFGCRNKLKKTSITLIPVNTSFETHITRKYEGADHPLVSIQTLHGMWLERMSDSGVNEDVLYKRIINYLSSRGNAPIHNSESSNAKTECYPIGSVAVIEHNDSIFYLLAISEFDDKNNAQSTADNIKNAMSALLKEYNERGQGYDLYIPLMGTGRSRAGLTHQESFDLIIGSLKENQKLIQGRIHIVIYPDYKNDVTVRW